MVRMKNRTLQAPTLALGHEQRVLHQGSTHVIRDRKTHQPARIAINDRSQVHIRPIRNRQIRNISDVEAVWLLLGEFSAHRIRKHCPSFVRDSGGDLAFLGVAEQLQGAHDPGDALVIDWALIRLVFELRGDAFGTVTAIFGSEDSLDPGTEDRVRHKSFFPC